MKKRKASEVDDGALNAEATVDRGNDATFLAASSSSAASAAPPVERICLITAIDNLTRGFPACSSSYEPVSKKQAAVLVPLFQDATGTVRVLLTQRSHRLSSHKGEVCLPGGKRDPEDVSDEATAVREAHEEVGLEPSQAVVRCSLPPCLSKHFLSVTPVVATIPSDFQPRANPNEVAAVFDVPLEMFVRPQAGRHSHKDCAWDDLAYRLHYFETDDGKFTIWGLTAIILVQVAKCAFGCSPSYEEHAPGSLSQGYIYKDIVYDETTGKVGIRKLTAAAVLLKGGGMETLEGEALDDPPLNKGLKGTSNDVIVAKDDEGLEPVPETVQAVVV